MSLSAKINNFKVFTRKVWALSLPYFRSEQKWKARALLAAIIVLNLAAVYLLVLLNNWNRAFYDALQNKNEPVFWTQLGRFTYLAFAFILIAVYRFYLTQLLELRWRAWMTGHYLQRWLSHHAFYQLELARYTGNAGATPDNPDQRIQEDLNLFTTYTISLTMGLLNAVVTLASFVGILWSLSGGFAFKFDGASYNIPGFMVWMAVLYCVAGSIITHYIGRPQIRLNFLQQRYEADFRHHMVRVREYSESIALDKGEAVERTQLDGRFSSVLSNFLRLIKAQKNLLWFTNFFGQAAVVFPFIVAAPRFFSGAIQLGELMQIASAFGRVQDSLGWFVDNYSSLAAWRATADRLTSFEEDMIAQSLTESATSATNSVATGALDTHDLTLGLPTGAVLLAGVNLRARAGDTVLIKGPSGSGKSTLFRAFAGIWPFATGRVEQPADSMFIPQRPYFPNGPLRDALAYPVPADQYSDEALRQALHDALLPQLADHLDEADAWGQKLSGGEQQRLAVARVLLKKPKWIFADEATSALDGPAEQKLYEKLLAQVKRAGGAIVSIAHRPSLGALHNKRWTLEPLPEGAPSLYQIKEEATR
ncbi:MAG: ABC transporter ATP-binding protein/permease [Burkholderiaceae bacterium]|nr:MAG: ABC transporter ATP-binding protein/permease [Burkholderiaceae bacterium]